MIVQQREWGSRELEEEKRFYDKIYERVKNAIAESHNLNTGSLTPAEINRFIGHVDNAKKPKYKELEKMQDDYFGLALMRIRFDLENALRHLESSRTKKTFNLKYS